MVTVLWQALTTVAVTVLCAAGADQIDNSEVPRILTTFGASCDSTRIAVAFSGSPGQVVIIDMGTGESEKSSLPGIGTTPYAPIAWGKDGAFFFTTVIQTDARPSEIWRYALPNAQWHLAVAVDDDNVAGFRLNAETSRGIFCLIASRELAVIDVETEKWRKLPGLVLDDRRNHFDWTGENDNFVFFGRHGTGTPLGIWEASPDGMTTPLLAPLANVRGLAVCRKSGDLAFIVDLGENMGFRQALCVWSRMTGRIETLSENVAGGAFCWREDGLALLFAEHKSAVARQRGDDPEIILAVKNGEAWTDVDRAEIGSGAQAKFVGNDIVFVREKHQLWLYEAIGGKIRMVFEISSEGKDGEKGVAQ